MRKLERLMIFETFKIKGLDGDLIARGFRIDDDFALTPAMLKGKLGDVPEYVTHIPSGFTPIRTRSFTFPQACVFVRFLRALPIDWTTQSTQAIKASTGVTSEMVAVLADIAIAVVE